MRGEPRLISRNSTYGLPATWGRLSAFRSRMLRFASALLFDTGIRQIECRHDCGSGTEQRRRPRFGALHCRGGDDGTDQIVVCASVDGVATLPPRRSSAPCNANEKAAKLTISQQPLFVRISTNNEIAKVNNNLDYEKLFSIYVTNAAGQGVSGVRFRSGLLPQYYYKGSMAFVHGRLELQRRPSQCVNEDTNFNGVLDSGDNNQNMDGLLWPGQSAAFTLDNNGVTDSAGFVVLRVRHGQRFAFWAAVSDRSASGDGGFRALDDLRLPLAPPRRT